jgi:hypothetical protein
MSANEASICKSLQSWLARGATTLTDVSTPAVTDVTTLFYKALRVNEKMNDEPGLAHRLQQFCLYGYGYCSKGHIQPEAGSGLSTQPERRQSPRVRGCPPWGIDHAGVRRGVSFPKPRCWRHTAGARTAVVKVASPWSGEDCDGGSGGKTIYPR